MTCLFRHMKRRDESAETHNLLRRDGEALGEVTGPRHVGREGVGVDMSERVAPTRPDLAFGAAIRMANLGDYEVVVTGDVSLWDRRWGTLTKETYIPVRAPERTWSAA